MIERAIQRIKPKHYPIIAFVLGMLAMFLMLTYSQLLKSGKYAIISGDAWEIYVPNIRMLLRNLSNGETLWYSFTTSMGYNTALTVAFELMSPFNILFLLFSKADPNVILAVIVILKVGLAATAFQLFSSKVLDNNRYTSVVFSVFYAMCAFTVEYCIINFMWLDGIYMLPIVAWATYVAVKKNKYLFLTLSYAYIFIVQFYMGYLIAGFSFVYFILLLSTEKKEERAASIGKSIGKYIFASIIAISLSAFIWAPVLHFLINHTVSDGTEFSAIEISALDVFNNMFWGEFKDYFTYPYVYCGLPGFILLPFFIYNREIPLKEKIVYGVLFVFFFLGCILMPLYKLFHGFDAPDMWNYRFSFIISFLICAMACKQSNFVSKIKLKWIVILCAFLFIIYEVEQGFQPMLVSGLAKNNNTGLIINVCFIAVWIILAKAVLQSKKNKMALKLVIISLTMAEVITNACVRTYDPLWKTGLTKEDYYYSWETDSMRNLAEIEKSNYQVGDGNFYRVNVMDDAIHNSDAYFGYYGVSDFNSAENEALREFMKNTGFYTAARRSSGTGLTPAMETILSVKDTARLYLDLSSIGIEVDTRVHENPYFLPVGYMVNDDVLKKFDFSSNVFENQNMIINAMSGVDGVYREIPEDNITTEEENMFFLEEDQTFYMTDINGGRLSFLVDGTEEPVFVQIAPYNDEESAYGLSWEMVMNRTCFLDSKVDVPFAAEMVQSGEFHKITLVASKSFSGIYSVEGLNIYGLSDEKHREMYESLAKETLELTEAKSGYIKGYVETSGERSVLFTSIPYTDGWEVTVDGKKQEIIPVINDTFCAIRIPDAGEHEIEMTYHCPGARLGLYISIAGIFLLAVLIFLERFNPRKKEKKEV